jgi:hypothetical protein
MHACHGQAEIFCVCMHMHVTGKRKFFCVCMHACTSRASTWGPSKIIHVCTTWGCHEFFLKCFDKFEIWKKFKFIKNIKYEIWSWKKKNWVGQISDLIQVCWTIFGPNELIFWKEIQNWLKMWNLEFGKKKIGLDNSGSHTSGLDNSWSKWFSTVQRGIETPVFPACKNFHFFRIGWFLSGVDHFSNFRIVRDPNFWYFYTFLIF